MISDEALVNQIKTRLGITTEYHDALLLRYANDVKEYMHAAGIPGDILDSEAAVGVISRGVTDLWNLGSGEGNFSGVFMQRVIQMKYTEWGALDTSGEPAMLIAISDKELDECTKCLDTPSDANGEQIVMTAMSEDDINACINCLKD